MPADDVIVSLENVTFAYAGADAPALRDVTLAVRAGEHVAVVGPGGSGKTTLCRLLTGALRSSPDFGSLAGRCLLQIPSRRDAHGQENGFLRNGDAARGDGGSLLRDGDAARGDGVFLLRDGYSARDAAGVVGSVSQDPETGLVMDIVEDEIAFGPENLCKPRERIEELIGEALDAVGLPQSLRPERILALSGGQQQRVAVAAALAMEPRLLVLDDAAANLDRAGAAQLAETLRRLKRRGAALVTASPRWDGAGEADRVAVLDGGRIAAAGAPRDVLAAHADLLRRLGCLPPPEPDAPPPAAGREHAGADAAAPTDGATCSRRIVLEARGLRYAYPGSGRAALHETDFAVREGEIVAVCGPNGSGKTTLGKLAAGLLPAPPDSLRILGKPVSACAPRELARLVGYVFQRPERQFVADTVLEECAFSLRARRSGRADGADMERAVRLLNELGLGSMLGAHPRSLPVAEQRLLNLASALVLVPALLVLDEPTAGLDCAAADRLMERVARFAAEGGAALVITHDEYVVRRWTHTRLTLRA